jgi:hypothetical protein
MYNSNSNIQRKNVEKTYVLSRPLRINILNYSEIFRSQFILANAYSGAFGMRGDGGFGLSLARRLRPHVAEGARMAPQICRRTI